MYESYFHTFIVIDTSLIAWVFKNFESESLSRLYIVVMVILVINIVVALLFNRILKEIKHLKDL